MMPNNTNQDDKEHQEENGLHDELAKALQATLKLGLRCTAGQSHRDIAKDGGTTGRSDQCGSQATDDGCAKKDAIVRVHNIFCTIATVICAFLCWERFAGQR